MGNEANEIFICAKCKALLKMMIVIVKTIKSQLPNTNSVSICKCHGHAEGGQDGEGGWMDGGRNRKRRGDRNILLIQRTCYRFSLQTMELRFLVR